MNTILVSRLRGCPATGEASRLVEEAANEIERLSRTLDGLPDGAIDGGWTAAGMSAYTAKIETELDQAKEDCVTMALRLMGEDDDTFAPETRDVMERWRPKCMALLAGEEAEAAKEHTRWEEAESRRAEMDAEMRRDAFGEQP